MTDRLVVTPAPGTPNLLLGAFDIASLGYVAEELFISGTASSYTPAAKLGADGRWSVILSGTADYTTRMVVLTPADAANFNGTVLVEWLNVSGGIDAPAVWFMAHRQMVREGYAYVAVSAQRVGVEGGASRGGADMSLKTQDPIRYAPLRHPGDAFSYDVFSHIGRLVRDAEHNGVLGPLKPEHVVAVGESQSALFLTTYVNAIDPLAKVYDGFLVHSRFAPAAPLDGSSIFEAPQPTTPHAVTFRPDLRVPLLTIITETDLFGGPRLGYYQARQPDNERLRTWEIPGTAHADNYTIRVAPIDTGSAPLDNIVAAYAPTNTLMGQQLAHFINFAPQHHYVLQAALTRLHEWIRTGEPAPAAPGIEITNADPPKPVLDQNGLARGGVRTPWVGVPIARTSGFGSDETAMSDLFGSGELFDAATLHRLYPGGTADYMERFTLALDAAIQSGFIVSADRAEILEIATATYSRTANQR
ncbi:MAG: alpha/beta hydrolase domain-containing protein [Mycobacterium sp.]|nr:alpha/beta hydrolase domain-containing protein [Mycobacterium sp.]